MKPTARPKPLTPFQRKLYADTAAAQAEASAYLDKLVGKRVAERRRDEQEELFEDVDDE